MHNNPLARTRERGRRAEHVTPGLLNACTSRFSRGPGGGGIGDPVLKSLPVRSLPVIRDQQSGGPSDLARRSIGCACW